MLKYPYVSRKANVTRQLAKINRHFRLHVVSHSVANPWVSRPKNEYPVAVTLLVSFIVFRLRLKIRFTLNATDTSCASVWRHSQPNGQKYPYYPY